MCRKDTITQTLPFQKKLFNSNPAGIYVLKVNNKNTRIRCEICSKLTIKINERCQWRCSGVFFVNFEHVIAGWEM